MKKNLRKNFWKNIALPIAIIAALVFVLILWSQNSKEESEKPKDTIAINREKTANNESSDIDTFVLIDELSLAESATTLYGTTTSKSQVSVFTEISGKITRVYAELGDYVNVGDVVIMLDDENERNNLTAAQLGLASAELGLEKTLSGSQEQDKTIAALDVQIKKDALEKTSTDAQEEIADIKIFLEAVLKDDIDDYFDHTDHDGLIYRPTFTFALDEDIEDPLEEARVNLETTWNTFEENIDSYSLSEGMEQSQKITQDFSDFTKQLYDAFEEVNSIKDDRKEEIRTTVLTLKESIDTENDIFDTLQNQFENQQSSLSISETTLSKVNAGPRTEDINIAQATINSNKNSVEKALDALVKKTLRSPISGKITEISADVGQLASSGSSIFSIQNPDNLKVLAAIPAEQRDIISVGKEILVDNIKAKVSAISPVIDADTAMINFEAVFTEPTTNLLSGTAVEITIPAEKAGDDKKYTSLPLSSVFEESGKYFVFLLSQELKAVKKEITFVNVSGVHIIAENIFTGTEQLIINARGISEGDEL